MIQAQLSYSLRYSLITHPLANSSAGNYKIYDMGLRLAEMFVSGRVEQKVELDKKHRLLYP